MNQEIKTIKVGDILSAESVCNSDCVFVIKVLARNKSMVTLEYRGDVFKKRVKVWEDSEYVMALGTYSMAPIFRALDK